jgi:hypothetical protein
MFREFNGSKTVQIVSKTTFSSIYTCKLFLITGINWIKMKPTIPGQDASPPSEIKLLKTELYLRKGWSRD